MADLYQLRGRVGRSKHKGYAYMLLPARAHVDPTARRRIQAVRQYADHGAGFRLAMRDLEIRGAGNLLGAEQSGHIAAVGFALYCQLLKRTIARLKDEPVPRIVDVDVRLDLIDLTPAAAAAPNSAVIPADYVADERLRIRLYRRLAESSSADDLRILREDFRDRFGPIPPALDRLLRIARLRIAAAERGLTCVEVAGDKLRIAGEGGRLVTTRLPSRPSKTAVEDHLEMLRHVIEAGEPQQSHHGSSSTR
jgi:transcription-repair coupling factor (superfamily II helicase)